MTVGRTLAKRSDARRNREAILEVARELFADSVEFPMTEVARRAGVGQGTLYRNFPDRAELAAAVMGEELDRLERLGVELADDPDAFFILLRSVADSMVRSNAHHLAEFAGRDPAAGSSLEQTLRRLSDIMRGPLHRAKVAGLVRRDLTIDDVVLVVRMARGAIAPVDDPAARASAAHRALTLALDGAAPSRH